MKNHIDKLQKVLNYDFSDIGLLKLALTHRSANKINNERLEFLGDSLLGYIIAEALYNKFPTAAEGELSLIRATFVNNESLADIARQIGLGEFVQLGRGEYKSGGNDRDSILADATEALAAAIYLDSGLNECNRVVTSWIETRLDGCIVERQSKDAKTQLQELMQASGSELPEYSIVRIEGEVHEQIFYVECKVVGVNEPQLSRGTSKRSAEQGAAQKMLLELESFN